MSRTLFLLDKFTWTIHYIPSAQSLGKTGDHVMSISGDHVITVRESRDVSLSSDQVSDIKGAVKK